MWVARQNNFSGNGEYFMSLNKMTLCKYEAYTEPNHTFYDDWDIRDDMMIVGKEVFEQTFGIKLESLEQIEI